MTVGYECWKKGIRVPSRGATTRSGVRYQYFNMRERGECSGNGVGGGGVGRVRRRDRDLESEGEGGAVGDVVTWDPVEQEGEGDHMEEVGVGSVQPQL